MDEVNEPTIDERVAAFRVEISLCDPPSWVDRDNVVARYEEHLRHSTPDRAVWFKRSTLEYLRRCIGRSRD